MNKYNNMGLIVAMGKNREIGIDNKLIWRIREDLNFFKNVTMNSYIIMGRKTYDSMPKNLEGRKYIVLSKNNEFKLDNTKILCHNISDVLNLVSKNSTSNFWVVGGGTIYEMFIPFVDIMHITKIEDNCPNADVYFPEFNIDDWNENISKDLYSEDNIKYKHVLLKRR